MPLNYIKKYPELLEILYLSERDRKTSLYGIFRRDIEDNDSFAFRGKRIYPIKENGRVNMEVVFNHLTTAREEDEHGNATEARVFEPHRSRRLHWIRHHIEERTTSVLEIFSCEERDRANRRTTIHTYIFDKVNKYIVVLLPQRSPYGYYLLTAYYLNKPGGEKKINKLKSRQLPNII